MVQSQNDMEHSPAANLCAKPGPEHPNSKNNVRIFLFACYLTGFLLGILTPNIIWKTGWQKKSLSLGYLFLLSLREPLKNSTAATASLLKQRTMDFAYLWELIQKRGSFFLLTALSGMTSFGIPWVIILLLFCGLECGLFLTLSILEFGFRGGLLGIGFYFPQLFFYYPVLFSGTWLVWNQSAKIWKNHGLYPRTTYRYLIRTAGLLVIFTIGILLEAWLNPYFIRVLIKYANY